MRHRVFVYGTLRKGGLYHSLLADADFLGEIRTTKDFKLLNLGAYPAMVPGHMAVLGELYEVPDALLADLDRLEGAPTLYYRAVIELADGSNALAYLLTNPGLRVAPTIESGDWKHR